MTDFIDEAIASADENPQPEQQETEIENQPEDDVESNDGAPEKSAKNEDNTPFPKKAVNAITRRDRQIGQLRAQTQQLQQQLRAMQQQASGGQSQNGRDGTPQPPKEDDYNTVGEYLDALKAYPQKVQEHFANQQKTQQQSQQQAAQAAWYEQRSQALAEKTQELMASTPELQQLVQENADVINAIPDHLEYVFLQLDPADAFNAAAALLREGKMESLFHLPPALAAAEIGRAVQRGAAKPKPISKAPAPMTPNRGAGGVSKQPHQMSADEIVDGWLKS